MRELGRPAEVHVYRNAGHGFANPDGKNFQHLAADDAWAKLKAFFQKHLKEV
jgi:dienelactone hydrolase